MKTNIFQYLDYRPLIHDFSKSLGISYKSLASSARMHGSYFSRVMKEAAIFSSEQLYAIGRNLKLKPEEVEFLLLLGDFNNSGDSEHKSFLRTKINKIQKEKSKLLNKFKKETTELTKSDVDLYYREAITAKIHMLLTLSKYRENPTLICKKIFINEIKLESELVKLIEMKIIERVKGDIKVLRNNVHLDETHPASMQNHINWRLQTINHLSMRGNDPSDYHLSATFSCDEETKNKIKEIFKDFVSSAQNEVRNCKSAQDVFFIGMDLF